MPSRRRWHSFIPYHQFRQLLLVTALLCRRNGIGPVRLWNPVGPNVGQNGESLAQPEVVPPVFIGVKLRSEELCDAVRGFDNSSLVNIPADHQLLHNFGNAVGDLVASILSLL